MATITSFTIGIGDRLPILTAVLTDDAGALIDLTGSTVLFVMWKSGTFTSPKVSAAATPDPDQVTNKGKLTYAWAAADTDTGDSYLAHFVITFASGKKETCPNDPGAKLKIRVGGAG